MKKVRFESPLKSVIPMELDECHSPRPYIENKHLLHLTRELETVSRYCENPIERYDTSNSSPFLCPATQTRTNVKSSCAPSTELELSFIDATERQAKIDPVCNSKYKSHGQSNDYRGSSQQNVLKPKLNENVVTDYQRNILNRNNDFFFHPRNSLDKINLQVGKIIHNKENVLQVKQNLCQPDFCQPALSQREIGACCTQQHQIVHNKENQSANPLPRLQYPCNCNNCGHFVNTCVTDTNHCPSYNPNHCHLMPKATQNLACHCAQSCSVINKSNNTSPVLNAVSKKTWCVEKYEKSKKGLDTDVQDNINIIKDNGEPTVSDLIKIITLQNEQIKLLQEKVDKVISNTEQHILPSVPIEYRTEQVNVQAVDNSNHKISIGVMTSFEMVRTSAFINKDFSKQNTQVQCNTSQIFIKEVVANTSPIDGQHFLQGIKPLDQLPNNSVLMDDNARNTSNEDKTVNDQSLCNLIVDNPITPQLSPDQSIYLDVQDYSDSDDDNTAVGWTYYNKVMTHVNGLLQDSDIPTSAAAMQVNAVKKLQMQIDRSNVSITKRVTFGEDIKRVHHTVPATSSDTSMRMNQLAAKYLKHNAPQTTPQTYPMTKPHPTVDMSFATRKYMEKHQLLQAEPAQLPYEQLRAPHNQMRSSPVAMPKFLDITALKKQPKLL